MTAAVRFWAKVSKTETCWLWVGARTDSGYGNFYAGDRRYVRAHRWAYETLIGPITEGLVLDHLCRNRACVNPAHLEPVTQGENVRRGTSAAVTRQRNATRTHCKHGHELTAENTRLVVDRTGAAYRECRTCRRATDRETKARRRAARFAT